MKKQASYVPQQVRSQQTLDRLLDACERLLQDTPFESITVADLVREARSSVGAFYSRFSSKEVMLLALYDRYDRELEARLQQTVQKIISESDGLVAATKAIAASVVTTYRKNRWLMRAFALHARNHPEMIDTSQREKRTAMHRRLAEALLTYRTEIVPPQVERLEFGLYFISATAREKILFAEAPHSAATARSDEELIQQLWIALHGYLTSPLDPLQA